MDDDAGNKTMTRGNDDDYLSVLFYVYVQLFGNIETGYTVLTVREIYYNPLALCTDQFSGCIIGTYYAKTKLKKEKGENLYSTCQVD